MKSATPFGLSVFYLTLVLAWQSVSGQVAGDFDAELGRARDYYLAGEIEKCGETLEEPHIGRFPAQLVALRVISQRCTDQAQNVQGIAARSGEPRRICQPGKTV